MGSLEQDNASTPKPLRRQNEPQRSNDQRNEVLEPGQPCNGEGNCGDESVKGPQGFAAALSRRCLGGRTRLVRKMTTAENPHDAAFRNRAQSLGWLVSSASPRAVT